MRYFKYLFGILIAAAFLALVFFLGGGQVESESRSGQLRIVSLSPAVTEILFALGMEEHIVGVTSVCDYPAEAKEIECIGGFGNPNIEKLFDLKPGLVIATSFENKTTREILQKGGVDVMDLKIRDFDELFAAVSKIGKMTGQGQRAEKLIADMQAELKAVENKYGGQADKNKPKIFVELWNSPLTTAGGQSFIDEVITRAGGINVAGGVDGSYPIINPEKVIEWDPDVIVLCYMESDKASVSQLAERIGWSEIKAVKSGRIINDIPLDIILRPGPRLVDGVKELAKRIESADDAD